MDSDKKIDFDEYVVLMRSLRQQLDKDDFVLGVSLRVELNHSREEVIMFRDLFRMIDVDGSGLLDFEEVVTMLGHPETLDKLCGPQHV